MAVPGFTGGTLDRAEPIRTNPEAYAAALTDWRGRLLALDGLEPRVDAEGRLEWTSRAEAPEGAELVLLGVGDGRPHFAALVPGVRATRSPRLMMALADLAPGEAATYAAARSLLDWHARHRFCANCGHGTGLHRAGWGRACPNCSAEHFPRVDPVVIMIAEHDDRALLGRQPSFPPGRYSALAGFLEVGESIEEAVAREIAEEAGVRVTNVRYVASQPWPFPSQLMIACVAQADSDALTLDTEELEDAIWVSRDEVRRVLAGEPGRFLPPPPIAIAHTLLTAWAGG
ncbi:NAD(+) diphosphatase [Sphingomonas aracearum]|uniref:NAD(+) diphosphatase n=1 Tax=Sphingomonas aracearum TaxID=2283317 RepID=A0A369VY11_9SPHN|nr:NAD(+) diphosphatase [Sphingomonas aracearum]RDE07276.1 NAD(+) diphosphatase [Sphingomonas aracearum]